MMLQSWTGCPEKWQGVLYEGRVPNEPLSTDCLDLAGSPARPRMESRRASRILVGPV